METLSHLKSTVTLSQQLRGVEAVIRGGPRRGGTWRRATLDRRHGPCQQQGASIGQGWRYAGQGLLTGIDMRTLPNRGHRRFRRLPTNPFVLPGGETTATSDVLLRDQPQYAVHGALNQAARRRTW